MRRPGLAVAPDAHVARRDAGDRAVLAVKHFGGGEARIDLHLQRLGLFRHPAADIAEAHDMVAAVAQRRRHERARHPEGAFPAEKEEPVLRYGRVQRRAALPPVGQQLVQRARIENGPRQDMGADLGALLDQADGKFGPGLSGKLLQADRRRQPCRAAADDDDIELHAFAFHVPPSPSGAHFALT